MLALCKQSIEISRFPLRRPRDLYRVSNHSERALSARAASTHLCRGLARRRSLHVGKRRATSEGGWARARNVEDRWAGKTTAHRSSGELVRRMIRTAEDLRSLGGVIARYLPGIPDFLHYQRQVIRAIRALCRALQCSTVVGLRDRAEAPFAQGHGDRRLQSLGASNLLLQVRPTQSVGRSVIAVLQRGHELVPHLAEVPCGAGTQACHGNDKQSDGQKSLLHHYDSFLLQDVSRMDSVRPLVALPPRRGRLVPTSPFYPSRLLCAPQ